MRRWLALGVLLLGLLTAGFFWSQERPSALAMQAPPGAGTPAGEGDDDDAAPPASDVTPEQREARRLARIDADDNGSVSRAEYLASRRKSFGRLDSNGNGSLDFEEYAAAAAKKFGKADADGDGTLSPAEYATTAAKRRARPACACDK